MLYANGNRSSHTHVWFVTSIVTLCLTFLSKVSYSIRTTNLDQSVAHLATNQTCPISPTTYQALKFDFENVGLRAHLHYHQNVKNKEPEVFVHATHEHIKPKKKRNTKKETLTASSIWQATREGIRLAPQPSAAAPALF
jgi:hypothetical protein